MTTIVTYWTRLEPIPRSEKFESGLRAEIADPLWCLSRQWQMGEFIGHDGGSIAHGEIKWSSTQLSKYGPRNSFGLQQTAASYNNDSPLEVRVEKEKVSPSLKLRVQMGQNFERMLSKSDFEKYVETFRRSYPLELPSSSQASFVDHDTKRFFNFMNRRVMDGYKFRRDLDLSFTLSPPEIPSTVLSSINSNDRQAIFDIAKKFHELCTTIYNEPAENDPNCWAEERLEYNFSVFSTSFDGPGQIVLVAPEYCEGSLDWYSFSVDPTVARILYPRPKPDIKDHISTFLPANVKFKGMPNKRWWDFEDATISLGAIDVDRRDIAKMIVMDFALVGGNDWFMIPLPIEVGSLARINSLMVTDVFGGRLLIKSADENTIHEGEKGWSMFKLSHISESGQPYRISDFLFLPPVLGPLLEGLEIEKVNFIRDEMANMAWAIEQKYESELGDPISGYESDVASVNQRTGEATGGEGEEGERGEEEEPNKIAKIKYLLQTRVPKNWIPFLPVHIPGSNRAVELQLGQMLEYEPGFTDTKPKSKLLQKKEDSNNDEYRIKEEEVPRAGVFVTRSFQRTRWTDGSTYLWIGRRKRTGHGEGSSGLRFDIIKDT